MTERVNPSLPEFTPWWTITQGALYVQCGEKLLYREVRAGRLKAIRIGGRRDIRTRREWCDAWLESHLPSESCA